MQGGYSMCTAEIVSPHVVMTAAHCVEDSQVSRFDVFLGHDLDDPAQSGDPSLWLKVSETHYDSKFNINDLENGHDIAVAILTKATTIPPLAINRTPLGQTNMGQMVRLVGYGVNNGWQQTGSGKKRVVSTPLADYDQKFVVMGDSAHGTCQGDSGGPAFMTIAGKEVIVGVTSFGGWGCQDGGWDTRIDTMGAPFVDGWINKVDPNTPGGGGGGGSGGPPNTGSGHLGPNPADVAGDPHAPDPGAAGDPLPTGGSDASSGCTMGGRPLGAPLWLGLVVLVIVVRRRRRATS
jgi:MYXO-CTERM domain-containing protein